MRNVIVEDFKTKTKFVLAQPFRGAYDFRPIKECEILHVSSLDSADVWKLLFSTEWSTNIINFFL